MVWSARLNYVRVWQIEALCLRELHNYEVGYALGQVALSYTHGGTLGGRRKEGGRSVRSIERIGRRGAGRVMGNSLVIRVLDRARVHDAQQARTEELWTKRM